VHPSLFSRPRAPAGGSLEQVMSQLLTNPTAAPTFGNDNTGAVDSFLSILFWRMSSNTLDSSD
jgi:hypothetical protein